jgi:hypothetical protein
MSNASLPLHHADTASGWQALEGLVHPAILSGPQLDWSCVETRIIGYLKSSVSQSPWLNQLAFLAVVLTTYAGLDVQTIVRQISRLHARWRKLFAAYGLTAFADWKPTEHIPRYLGDAELSDTPQTRQSFLRVYCSSAQHTQAYLRSLPSGEQEVYQQWALPILPPEMYRHLSRAGELLEAQQMRRKAETDAVTPHFARIRGEAHLRWNELQRLRTKFTEAVALVESGQETLPVAFSYEEARDHRRLHFKLWDRSSFVLSHAEQYSYSVVHDARIKKRAYRPERNLFFLEFVGAERLSEIESKVDPDALLWFGDILRYDLLCYGPMSGSEAEVKRKQTYLRSWGYTVEDGPETTPFHTSVSGLLAWPKKLSSRFFLSAQKRAQGLLLQVEPLFAAATLGLAALDFFTTTGARMNELQQISLTSQCLHTLSVEGTQRLLLRLVPKGTDKLADYIVGPETRRNFEKVALMLQDHYHLQADQPLPSVSFDRQTGRATQFPGKRPYLFQFNGQHLPQEAITACVRFLCHGLVFQTQQGRPVLLKAHLLRHVFATHIHHVEAVPLDIVAVILHQKNLRVAGYYAAPPWQKVVATANSLLDRFATHLGSVEDAFVRAPGELQRQFEEAKQQVGTLAKVAGGVCTCHAICPISFACTGCAFKIPDPARRDEIVEQQEWASVRLLQVKKRGLGPETIQMEALLSRCRTELEEMTTIETYQKDEHYAPKLTIEPQH